MASKENQMSLDIIAKALPFETYICYIHTLQQAIDNEELYRKSFELVLNQLSKYEYSDINWLDQARKELENEKTQTNADS